MTKVTLTTKTVELGLFTLPEDNQTFNVLFLEEYIRSYFMMCTRCAKFKKKSRHDLAVTMEDRVKMYCLHVLYYPYADTHLTYWLDLD